MDITIHHPWFCQTMAFSSLFPPHLFDQRFGEGLMETDLMETDLMSTTLCPYYMCFPSIQMPSVLDLGLSEMKLDKDKFPVLLDVKHLSPKELNVKVVGDYIEVHTKHEERLEEHGYISREFHCCYMIPNGIDPSALTSTLSPDGVLSITAPTKAPALEWNILISCQEKPAVTGK